jgi:hypothetical protein
MMSDYGRYSEDSHMDRDRDRQRGWSGGRSRSRDRDNDSIFNLGSRDRDDDRSRRDRSGGRDDSMGGWAGSGRTSAYDEDRGGRTRRDGRFGNGRNRDSERNYGRDDHKEGLPVEETSRLIASNKVEGTAVYGRNGDRLGTIYNFMVDKYSGQVEYAVMTYGGFLGMGQRYYPLPWRVLDYDTREGGYVVDMSERDLEDAPSFDRNSEPRFSRDYGERVHSWYGLQY